MANPSTYQLIDDLHCEISKLRDSAKKAVTGTYVPYQLSDAAKSGIRQIHHLIERIDVELEIAWCTREMIKGEEQFLANKLRIEELTERSSQKAFEVVLESARSDRYDRLADKRFKHTPSKSQVPEEDSVELKTLGDETAIASFDNTRWNADDR